LTRLVLRVQSEQLRRDEAQAHVKRGLRPQLSVATVLLTALGCSRYPDNALADAERKAR